MKKLLLTVLFAGTLLSCAPKPPDLNLPVFTPLPAVHWEQGADGSLCLTPAEAKTMRQREELRNVREGTYREMLKALGAK